MTDTTTGGELMRMKSLLLAVLLISGCGVLRPIEAPIPDGGEMPARVIDGYTYGATTDTPTTEPLALMAVTTTTVPTGLYSTWLRTPVESDPRPVNTGVACRVLVIPRQGYLLGTYGAPCFYGDTGCDALLKDDPLRDMPHPPLWTGPQNAISDTWGCPRWPGRVASCLFAKVRTTFQKRSDTDHVLYGFELDAQCKYCVPGTTACVTVPSP